MRRSQLFSHFFHKNSLNTSWQGILYEVGNFHADNILLRAKDVLLDSDPVTGKATETH